MNHAFCQSKDDSLITVADNFYNQKDFPKAAINFERAAEVTEFNVTKSTYYFYTAAAFVHAGDIENSFRCLHIAIDKYGFNDDLSLKDTRDFDPLHSDKRWDPLIKSIKVAHTNDPLKARFYDSDVKLFWKAYDLVQRDTANAYKIYKQQYVNKGSNAFLDYYVSKIYSLNSFTIVHKEKKKFYSSIRPNTLQALKYKSDYVKSFVALKGLYPQASFPNVYFVIGKLNSAGTSTSNGLILGIDQMCRTNTTDVSEFKPTQLHYLAGFDNLPYTVAHELIHFQQNDMASDTTLLREAILEGMADFIGELISGKGANSRLAVLAKGHERKIWEDFKKDMYFNRKRDWIANGDQETPEKPADLGYWVGYRICKAYYEEQKDKKQAIYDMLHVQDYRKFLELSKLDQKL